MSKSESKTVVVANHHTGGIVFPRMSAEGLALPPIRLAPGTTTPIDGANWDAWKKMKVVQHYLDKNIIAVVKREKAEVNITDNRTSDLKPPEHLQTDEEALEGQDAAVKVKITRKKAGSITL